MRTISTAARHRSTRRLGALAGVLAAALVVSLASCGDGDSAVSSPPVAAPKAMTITVNPAADAAAVEPDSTVTVGSSRGTLKDVSVVDSTGTQISGELSEDGTAWVADRRLAPNERYTVKAEGASDTGKSVSQVSRFETLTVAADKRLASSSMLPLDGSTVGIAHPIVVQFNQPVVNRAAVTETLEIETSKPVQGSWYWIDASTVHYRPKEFWPVGTEVTFAENLVGIDAGNGMWGVSRRENSFTVGRSQILKVDVDKRQLRVVRDGETIRSIEVSTGKRGWETRNGIKVLMEKERNKRWTNEAIDAPEEYDLRSDYAIRMTNSGEFLHDAPWNRGLFGERNGSHGCVGMTTGNMRWLFHNTLIGDPVITTGSPKEFTNIWNRYQDWNVDWKQWQTGNFDLSDG